MKSKDSIICYIFQWHQIFHFHLVGWSGVMYKDVHRDIEDIYIEILTIFK